MKSIEALFLQMQEGKMAAFEMEELVELTRELHERALILRYKSYEEQVFGIRPEAAPVAAEPEPVSETVVEPVLPVNHEQPAFFEAPEPEPQIEPVFEPKETAVDEQPVFDFALFDEPETEPEPEPVHVLPFPVMEELKEVPAEKEPAFVPEEITATPAVEAAPVVTPTPPVQTTEDIFKNMSQTDNSLVSRWQQAKLETLVGAFGLNEKLQCIRELFDGSGDAFNQAIQLLDNQQDHTAAKQLLVAYIQEYKWDLESESAKEFIQKIERRYA